jgi:hypothetical protein
MLHQHIVLALPLPSPGVLQASLRKPFGLPLADPPLQVHEQEDDSWWVLKETSVSRRRPMPFELACLQGVPSPQLGPRSHPLSHPVHGGRSSSMAGPG